jgi:Regulator of chromosome condensation (RCC1) repeat
MSVISRKVSISNCFQSKFDIFFPPHSDLIFLYPSLFMTKKAADTIESSSATTNPSTLPSSSPSFTARRSFRVSKRDPIVAPGFGTQSDLQKLARDLDLPLEAVQAIMSSQGRGITRRSRKEQETSTTEPVLNSAWSDFLSSEQPPATETNAVAISVDSKLSTEQRNYQFPWAKPSNSPVSKKSKKDTESGGLLVQTGTLDATCVGRTRVSATNTRVFDLSVPSILLPRLNVRRVIASCTSAHALAIDTNGTVYGWGRNEASQLGAGLPANVARPFALEGLSPENIILDGAVGKSHSIVFTKSRELFAVGSNKSGQCGLSKSQETIAQFRKCNGASDIVQVRYTPLHLYIIVDT